MPHARLQTRVPVDIEFPEQMRHAVAYVLDGEYESGLDATGLTILDIGANVGSFALWAMRRWPGSTVHCYEANPDTFALLAANTRGLQRIHAVNAAVFPTSNGGKARFFSRYAGDGEAGLLDYIGDTFRAGVIEATHEVDVVTPALLPEADVIKLDIEGGEAAVLEALDLGPVPAVVDFR